MADNLVPVVPTEVIPTVSLKDLQVALTTTNTPVVTNIHGLAYTALIVGGLMLAALGQQVAAGKVPIPAEWSWITPVLEAGLFSLTMLLPKVTDTFPQNTNNALSSSK